jgi:hypothetical protein
MTWKYICRDGYPTKSGNYLVAQHTEANMCMDEPFEPETFTVSEGRFSKSDELFHGQHFPFYDAYAWVEIPEPPPLEPPEVK